MKGYLVTDSGERFIAVFSNKTAALTSIKETWKDVQFEEINKRTHCFKGKTSHKVAVVEEIEINETSVEW